MPVSRKKAKAAVDTVTKNRIARGKSLARAKAASKSATGSAKKSAKSTLKAVKSSNKASKKSDKKTYGAAVKTYNRKYR